MLSYTQIAVFWTFLNKYAEFTIGATIKTLKDINGGAD
jgi:hypothetical protein